MVVSLISCQDEPKQKEIIEDSPPLIVGLLRDGSMISSVDMYCNIEKKRNPAHYVSAVTVENYKDVEFPVLIKYNKSTIINYVETRVNSSDYPTLSQEYLNYTKEKSYFMINDFLNDYANMWKWKYFFTAYTAGPVTMTCDKDLFGVSAGENISSHFDIEALQSYMPVGIEDPILLYKIGEVLPKRLSDFFKLNSWLYTHYFLSFDSEPAERYKELTLTLTLPVIKERVVERLLSKSKGENAPIPYDTVTYVAKCHVLLEGE